MRRRLFNHLSGLLLLAATTAHGQGTGTAAASSAPSQALDGAAFSGVDETVRDHLPDVQSVVVLLGGRVAYQFYRDGQPDALRDVQSVAKSALSTLTGIALGQGRIASLDQKVVALVPDWAALNADPRAAEITVRHLLTMTAGFTVDDPGGIARVLPPRAAWARPLRQAPGQAFVYDNSTILILTAVLEQATGMPLTDYARLQLVQPLGMAEPAFRPGLWLRTLDMAKIGQLALRNGVWDGRQIVPQEYVLAATAQQNSGGPPVSLPYGYLWWLLPSEGAARRTFFANGFGGQYIWVDPALDMVIATTSTVSPESNRRGQARQLIRAQLYPAVRRRAANGP